MTTRAVLASAALHIATAVIIAMLVAALQIRFRPARDRAGNPTGGTVRWRCYFEP